MAISLQLHEVDIHDYARYLVAELEDTECPFEWVENQQELKIWRANDGSWKAELLLVYGGPTVKIELDSRYTFGTLYHSWGANPETGKPQRTIEFQHTILKDAIREIGGLE
tara:strand:+ start:1975 stop:2307 length:333 start_codon:yes stop_codon:yes gene_type:complete